jgi:hypothetical protein
MNDGVGNALSALRLIEQTLSRNGLGKVLRRCVHRIELGRSPVGADLNILALDVCNHGSIRRRRTLSLGWTHEWACGTMWVCLMAWSRLYG